MAKPMNKGRSSMVVGQYVVGKQIGAGSYSTVWHARHSVHGTQVAIKEIIMSRLNSKLQDNLKSEIAILKRINHPNIVQLHDMIEETGKMYIVLEYCEGGDVSMFIQQRQGKIPEATAKHFMQQLADGLKVLRENSLMHRDLKPQNLLLTKNDDNSILKIADFGFARSLQPRSLAETLCGSPLYMAPEIMQLQKYDAKADLWSVGAILFQLVTGRTPFMGNNPTQLLQNIMRSKDVNFPPDANPSADCIDLCRKLLRRNPVERLTFEEFFNHPFLSQREPDKLFWRPSPRVIEGFPLAQRNPSRNTEQISPDDCLPFSLDDDSSGIDGNPSFVRRSPLVSTHGFALGEKVGRKEASNTSSVDPTSRCITIRHKPENMSLLLDGHLSPEGKSSKPLTSMDPGPAKVHSKVVDSLELIDQDYVLVSGPPMDISTSASTSKCGHLPPKSASPVASGNSVSMSSAPVPIVGAETGTVDCIGSLGNESSAPSQSSVEIGDAFEQPSTDCMTRINSLRLCAAAIKELVNQKINAGRQLEAFSIQLVILSIWKQALHICHTQAASAIEGSPTQESARLREISEVRSAPNILETSDTSSSEGPQDVCSKIEKAFLFEVGNAEDFVKFLEPGDMEMPDAMEAIYQSALALGRHGAVDEYMGDTENAAILYSKALRLLVFLLVEAPTLIINPPFSLTNLDRYRLRTYIDALSNRQSISRSQRIALLKCEDQGSPSQMDG